MYVGAWILIFACSLNVFAYTKDNNLFISAKVSFSAFTFLYNLSLSEVTKSNLSWALILELDVLLISSS